jgi:hypothetical protein
MRFPDDQIEELKAMFGGVGQGVEGGVTYFLLPGLMLPEGCAPSSTDALLCPTPRDGYNSRLFFANRIQSRQSLNWNAVGVRIFERNWNAFSWQVSRQGLRLTQLVSAHLGALR